MSVYRCTLWISCRIGPLRCKCEQMQLYGSPWIVCADHGLSWNGLCQVQEPNIAIARPTWDGNQSPDLIHVCTVTVNCD